jgi:hypothetical protein
MKLSNFLILNAVIALAFGIGFVLLPATTLTIYGLDPNPSINLMGQFFGVELIAVGLLCWFVKDDSDTAVMPKIILALLIADIVGLIVSLMGTLSGIFNALGWSAVLIYLVLVVGYAYFRFGKNVAQGHSRN